jgi:hypothetical protein
MRPSITGLDWRIFVTQKGRKAADPFHQRREIRLSEPLLKLDQIAFPMPELLAIRNDIRAVHDV